MKSTAFLIAGILGLAACGESSHYEKNIDFKEKYWLVQNLPTFDFEIEDVNTKYDLFITVRNESDYQNSNLYYMYYLTDSTGITIKKDLKSEFLFDRKTGRPLGSSALGDIYSHQFPLLTSYTFPTPGKYSIRYEQFMRTDTLRGVLSVGLMIEKSVK